MCRAEAAKLNERRQDFVARGVKLVAVSPLIENIEDFRKVCWPEDDIYIDEGAEFKNALGDRGVAKRVSLVSLMRPSVIGSIVTSSKFGTQGGDIEDRTLTVGGTIVINPNSEVLFAESEASTYSYPSVDSVLSACPAAESASVPASDAPPAVASSAA